MDLHLNFTGQFQEFLNRCYGNTIYTKGGLKPIEYHRQNYYDTHPLWTYLMEDVKYCLFRRIYIGGCK